MKTCLEYKSRFTVIRTTRPERAGLFMCATSVDNGVQDRRFAKYDFDESELSLNKLISLFRTGMYATLKFQVFVSSGSIFIK